MARKATPKKRQTSASQSSLRDYKPVKKATVRKGKVRAKPKQYPQRKVPGTDKQIDRSIRAKPVGWRISDKTGRRYFEDRENRSDTDKERRYHGGVNRRAEPAKRTAKPSTRTTRSTTTSRRVSQVGKRDTQKGHRVKVSIYVPDIPSRKGKYPREKFYDLTGKPNITARDLKKLICEEEKRICEKKVEHLAVFDREKGLYYTNIGGDSSVGMNDSIYGNRYICTHNHPEEYGFPNVLSGSDLAVMIGRNLYEVRACCYGYVYSVKIGKCTLAGYEAKTMWDSTVKSVANEVSQKFGKFKERAGESDSERRKRHAEWRKQRRKKIWAALDREFKSFCNEVRLEYKRGKICST